MSKKAKILVVENELPVAMLMVHLLSEAGCEVEAAHTGRKAMALAREIPFDLIALGVDLPDVDGFEICDELKQWHITRRTPVILISNRSFTEDSQRSLEAGAADHIMKPFQSAGFVQRIVSVIETHKKLAAAF
jgi:DNA-binding response OmpR family regulator